MEPTYPSEACVLTQHWGTETNIIGLFSSAEGAQKMLPLIKSYEWERDGYYGAPFVAKLGSLTYRITEYQIPMQVPDA